LPTSQKFPSLGEWFRVQFNDAVISLPVNPPNRTAWEAQISWQNIIRVCFHAGHFDNPDEI